MAIKQTTTLVDDLDGGEADRTVRFGLDGVDYEIDLAESNIEDLAAALAPFIAVARPVAGRARRVSSAGPSPTRPRSARPATASRNARTSRSADTATIREWATAHGFSVGERGRIPDAIKQAWAEAN
jgi:hypothetical protein